MTIFNFIEGIKSVKCCVHLEEHGGNVWFFGGIGETQRIPDWCLKRTVKKFEFVPVRDEFIVFVEF